MPRKLFIILIRRRVIVAFLLLLQCALFVILIVSQSNASVWVEYGLMISSWFVVAHIAGGSENNAYKLIWTTLILAFPVFGGLFYLLLNYQSSMRTFRKELKRIDKKSKPLYLLSGDRFSYINDIAHESKPQIQYLQKHTGFPVYIHTKTEYLTPGEVKFERLIEALQKAEKYIFLEYFSIDIGIMWNSVLAILKNKASQGVDVRIIYDDVGCLLLLPKDYPEKLAEMGIKSVVFNPIRPLLKAVQNNRDHRKIAVIDGKIAITGGINLADEYINAFDKFGHWKDSAIMLEGEAAWSFTLMFLQLWSNVTKTEEDFSQFYPWHSEGCTITESGLVQPYADSPLNDERVSENVYLQIISNAKEYVYINTPYLIIDDIMISALTLAAKSGVDVRIVTPHRPDKKLVHVITRSYYKELISAGVKIYEYTNGFIHAKTFVSDGRTATVGSANLDYRSLYLSFECGVCLYNCQTVLDIRDDFIKTLNHCHQISEAECEKSQRLYFIRNILRLFAPLL